MNTDQLLELRRCRNVIRWHTWPHADRQNLADHQWSVALTCAWLCEWNPSRDLLLAALLHDAHEIETGDVPSTASWRFGKNQSPEIQVKAQLGGTEVFPPLNADDQKILFWADKLDMLLYANEQRELGMRTFDKVFDRVVRKLLPGWPNAPERVRELFMSCMEERGYLEENPDVAEKIT
ncbi:MAG TPA: YfbR-like 5'-deoxynucleotidase [Terriglobales bacterium]